MEKAAHLPHASDEDSIIIRIKFHLNLMTIFHIDNK